MKRCGLRKVDSRGIKIEAETPKVGSFYERLEPLEFHRNSSFSLPVCYLPFSSPTFKRGCRKDGMFDTQIEGRAAERKKGHGEIHDTILKKTSLSLSPSNHPQFPKKKLLSCSAIGLINVPRVRTSHYNNEILQILHVSYNQHRCLVRLPACLTSR